MSVPERLETERLLLPALTQSDADLLARLSAEPAVVRYIGDGHPWSSQRCADVMSRMVEHWQTHGFGWRIAIERETGEPVGSMLLNYLGEGTVGLAQGEFEIGWWLFPNVWGRGFASEGIRAICEEAFTRVGAPSVVARILPANGASVRVAERLGMSLDFQTTGRFGEPVVVYRLEAGDWSGVPGSRIG
jgi:RimJ/RimL family protein N-acetyltransferase